MVDTRFMPVALLQSLAQRNMSTFEVSEIVDAKSVDAMRMMGWIELVGPWYDMGYAITKKGRERLEAMTQITWPPI